MGILDSLNPFSRQGPVPTNSVNRGMSDKYLTSTIGTAGSGKTCLATQVFYVARTLSQQLQGFYCDIKDTNSTIMRDVARMESGHFPPKTKAYNTYAYQAELNLWWGKNSLWGSKAATFQVCDLAGEDLVAQSQYKTTAPDPIAFSQAAKLVDYIYRSDIFLLVAPASRAPIFDGDVTIEQEDSDIAVNPDVNLASIFGMIVNRRKQHNMPIKGIGLCITKCDMVDKYLEKKYGWNIYKSEDHQVKFLNKYFPWTSMKIKALTDTWCKTEVKIFPMFIETKKDSDGNQLKWQSGFDEGNPIIDTEDRVIKHNGQACVELVNFVGRLTG